MYNEQTNGEWLLHFLLGTAFCGFPIRLLNYRSSGGIILVAEDQEEVEKIFNFLSKSSFSVVVTTEKERKISANNFEFVIKKFNRYEKMQKIIAFMESKSFLPVLLVVGILPEELEEYNMVFRWKNFEYNFEKLQKNEKILYDFCVENTDYLIRRIKQFRSSKCIMKLRRMGKNKDSIIWAAVIGEVWKEIFRKDDMSEEEAEHWFYSYLKSAIHALEESDRLRACFDSDLAVRTCVLRAVEQGEIVVNDIRNSQNLGNEILFDKNFYFIPEQLLKKICSPLLETASFVQIKKELRNSGMIESNDVDGNYTVKVCCFNFDTGKTQRFRFLKIHKENLMTDEGLTLEDLVFYIENKESEKGDL